MLYFSVLLNERKTAAKITCSDTRGERGPYANLTIWQWVVEQSQRQHFTELNVLFSRGMKLHLSRFCRRHWALSGCAVHCHLLSCPVRTCHVMLYYMLPWCVRSCHVPSEHAMSCFITYCHELSGFSHVPSEHAMSCCIICCHGVSGLLMSRQNMPCHV